MYGSAGPFPDFRLSWSTGLSRAGPDDGKDTLPLLRGQCRPPGNNLMQLWVYRGEWFGNCTGFCSAFSAGPRICRVLLGVFYSCRAYSIYRGGIARRYFLRKDQQGPAWGL